MWDWLFQKSIFCPTNKLCSPMHWMHGGQRGQHKRKRISFSSSAKRLCARRRHFGKRQVDLVSVHPKFLNSTFTSSAFARDQDKFQDKNDLLFPDLIEHLSLKDLSKNTASSLTNQNAPFLSWTGKPYNNGLYSTKYYIFLTITWKISHNLSSGSINFCCNRNIM